MRIVNVGIIVLAIGALARPALADVSISFPEVIENNMHTLNNQYVHKLGNCHVNRSNNTCELINEILKSGPFDAKAYFVKAIKQAYKVKTGTDLAADLKITVQRMRLVGSSIPRVRPASKHGQSSMRFTIDVRNSSGTVKETIKITTLIPYSHFAENKKYGLFFGAKARSNRLMPNVVTLINAAAVDVVEQL